MAFPRGFEPPAYRLGGGRSIQLIYGNIFIYAVYNTPKNGFCQTLKVGILILLKFNVIYVIIILIYYENF